ncbi:PAS domain S-box protein [Caldovatus aquaticus]|uniref:histidine kinase n=1 Tax=Caldovatus aquaticus TaxID=2865671 RepID=A0ABS7F042_9PROT|nr:PAS domain S-box protein [Caldovatus aquaticus]MBW8268996.1 PAS domain S-box protein [Caldovatus aquaticus]
MPSLRQRLLVLAALALLPAWGFAGFAAWRYARAERAHLERSGRDVARTIAGAVDSEVAALRGALRALAASPALAAGDLAAFRRQAERLRPGEHVQVLLADPAGRPLLDTRLSEGAALPPRIGDPDLVRRALEGDAVAVSGVFPGPASGSPVVALALPLRDPATREARYVLLAGTDAVPYWSPLLPRAGLPEGWIASIADAGGTILARHPAPERYVGLPVHPDALAAVAAGAAREGWAAGASRDDQRVYVAYARLSQAPWTALVGVPGEAVDGALRRAMLPVLLGGGALFAVTLASAGLAGTQLARSLGGLAAAARALGRGETPGPGAAGPAPVREAALIAAALAEAAAERRAHEAALAAGEARLRAVIEAVPVGVLIAAAPDGRIVAGNPQAERILRQPIPSWPNVDAFGERIAFHADGRPVAPGEFPLARVLRGGEADAALECLYRRGDGTDAWLRLVAAAIRDRATGALTGAVAAILDVDRERRADAALRDLNVSLERRAAARTAERDRLFQLSLDLFGVLGFDGRIRETNPAWSAALGMTGEELRATPCMELVHPEDRAASRAQVARLLAGERVEWFENRVRRAHDGTWRRFVWTAVAEPPGAEDRVFYCVGRDVTEERAREEQLRQAQRMEAVGQLTGGVAHDFNNLLHVISANLELLRDAAEAAGERARRRHAAALDAARRGASLTRQLLAYARRQPLEPRAFDPGRLLRETAELLRRTLGETIRVETVVEGGLWPAFADPGQMQNALINLAVNARDAMPEGGTLTLEACNAYLDDRYAAAHAEVAPGQYVVFAVTDTGTGMAPEVAARAFEPFFTTKEEGKGTGLGLAMVYGFAKQSGGHVKLYTEVGHGTTAKLYLPRARPEARVEPEAAAGPDAAAAAEAARRAGGTAETVLVVEDDPAVRATVSEMLRDLGYRVLAAPDGAAALALLEGGAPIAVLFSDVVMPGPVRAPELARRAREMRPGIAVLFTSGYTENSIVHQGRLDPGVRLLSKPYARGDLALRLRAALAEARGRTAAARESDGA